METATTSGMARPRAWGQAPFPGQVRNLPVHGFLTSGRNHQHTTIQLRRFKDAFQMLYHALFLQRPQRRSEFGRYYPYTGTGIEQLLHLAHSHLTAAGHQARPLLDIEKYGKKVHAFILQNMRPTCRRTHYY